MFMSSYEWTVVRIVGYNAKDILPSNMLSMRLRTARGCRGVQRTGEDEPVPAGDN